MDIRMCSVITLHFKHLANIPVIALAGTRRAAAAAGQREISYENDLFSSSLDGEIHQVTTRTCLCQSYKTVSSILVRLCQNVDILTIVKPSVHSRV